MEKSRNQATKFQVARQVTLTAMFALLAVFSFAVDYYVSPTGNDGNSGSISQPFATLEGARTAIRDLKSASGLPVGGVTVYMRGGTYFRTSTFSLTSLDSGGSNSPIVYKAYPGEQPQLIGGSQIPSSWFSTLTSSSSAWSRINTAARGNVLQADLGSHGVTNYGTLVKRGYATNPQAAMEIFYNGEAMTLARWPNSGFVNTVAAPAGQYGGQFTYSDTRPSAWTQASDVWFMGYWHEMWAETYAQMSSLNTGSQTITLSTSLPYGIGAGMPYYALNLLEELDTPGEYYIDRPSGILYFWPTSSISSGQVLASVMTSSLISMSSTSYVTLEGLTMEACRGNAVSISGGTSSKVLRCTIRNTGTDGITVSGGTNHGIEESLIYNIGDQGAIIDGGTRSSLTPGNHYVRNNEFRKFGRWDKTIRAAIRVYGVGTTISHNEIHDAPHLAIMMYGNNHVVEYNDIYNVLKETGDAGVIYTGRDWGSWGNILRYNFIHDISSVNKRNPWDLVAFYNDDCDSGDTFYGNILYNIDGIGFLIGGGRDNTIDNNLIVNCGWGLFADQRGLAQIQWDTGQAYSASWDLEAKVEQYNYTSPPWSTSYPKLAQTMAQGQTEASHPKGNVVARNVFYNNSSWQKEGTWGASGAFNYFTFTDNLTNSNPLFVNAGALNMNLQPSSPAYSISGFQTIPFDDIGIQTTGGQSPVITTQPASKTVVPGGSVTFTVAASGASPMSYQWKKNGTSISGATSASYTINPVQISDAGSYTCTVTNVYGSATSNAAALSTDSTPVIVSHPASATVNVGGSATFSVTASGAAPLNYQWKRNGTDISGQTNNSMSIASAQTTDAGSYNCVVSNSSGSVQSNAANLTVNVSQSAPYITEQLPNTAASPGDTVTLSFGVAGTAPFSYMWRKETTILTNETNPTLVIENIQEGDESRYWCRVSNSLGHIDTRMATLSVNDLPAITAHPVSWTVNPGASVAFSVTASNATSYQWQKNAANIPGATSASYVISSAQQSNEAAYRCVVSNVSGSVQSSEATLTVNDAPVIATQPGSYTVLAGAAVNFTVAATGTAPFSYQWQKNGTAVSGATAASYAIAGVQSASAGSYTCVVANVAGSVESQAGVLVVNVPAAIITQPVSKSIQAGESATFTVAATGDAPLNYQWLKDGASLSGETGTNCVVASASEVNAGSYTCRVTNPYGTALSNAAALTVNAAAEPPTITVEPADKTVNPGENLTLTVMVSGSVPFTYQWYNGGSAISGATSANYDVAAVQESDEAGYWCRVSNLHGLDDSRLATVTVNDPPVIATQPASRTVNPGTQVTFNISATGTDPLTFQWLKDEVAIVGETAAICSVPSAESVNQGVYTCRISNMAGSVVSSGAILTVNAAPSITTQPVSRSAAEGAAVSFTVAATGSGPLAYQWKKNGTAIAGATTATYSIASVQTGDAGGYLCTVTNTYSSVDSNTAILTVDIPQTAPQLTAQLQNTTANPGETVTLSFGVSGTAPLSYMWRRETTILTSETNPTLVLSNIQEAAQARYWCRVSNAYGHIDTRMATVTVNDTPGITSQPASQSVSPGAPVNFSVAVTGTGPFTYQWRKDGVDIANATLATYAVASAQQSHEGQYTCRVTNSAGSVISNAATLVVYNPPAITQEPQDQTIEAGASVSFSVVATGDGTLAYQWRKDGVAVTNSGSISGATLAALTINPCQTANTGSYTCVVTNAYGNGTSAAAVLTVQQGAVPATIETDPVSQTVLGGENVALRVTATGDQPLTYQWKKSGANLTDDGRISGSKTANLAIQTIQTGDAGSYVCQVTNASGSDVSAVAQITVNDAAPTIVQQPPFVTYARKNSNAELVIVATGAGPMQYQWRKNGVNLVNGGDISGADTATLTIAKTEDTDSGNYTCVITNSAGTATSNGTYLWVLRWILIRSQPQPTTVNSGEAVILSLVAEGDEITHQWTKDGLALEDDVNIVGAQTSRLTIYESCGEDTGDYQCVVSDPLESVPSEAANVTVIEEYSEPRTAVKVWESYQ